MAITNLNTAKYLGLVGCADVCKSELPVQLCGSGN